MEKTRTFTKTEGTAGNSRPTNIMRKIFVEKITLNIGVGEAGDKLEKAIKLLSSISKSKPVKTITLKRIPSWGVRPKLTIGCKVTIRKNRAEELLKRLLNAVGNTLNISKFDNNGNVSFGIAEYIDIPGVEYSPEIGIIGLDIAVTLARPGFRIKRRRIKKKRIPKKHSIKKEEAVEFFRNNLKVEVTE